MQPILTFLSGKKTYLIVGTAMAVQCAVTLGYLDEATANTILTFLGIGTMATLRAGVSKAIADAKTPPAA